MPPAPTPPTPPTPPAPPSLQITSYTPTSAPKDAILTITGQGFSATPGEDGVTINNVPATVLTATATTLTVKVPLHAGSGSWSRLMNDLRLELLLVYLPILHRQEISMAETIQRKRLAVLLV